MGKVIEIDCEKSMKLKTSPKVTRSKYKRRLHWCRSISKELSVQVLLQYQSKVITLSGRRFVTVSGVFYYIIGHVLQYRTFITLSVGTLVFASITILVKEALTFDES